MSVFFVNTPVTNAAGRPVSITFEHACASIEDLTAYLQEKGIISGYSLRAVDDGRGGKLVQSRKPIALTIKGIASIHPYDFRIWEPEDSPA